MAHTKGKWEISSYRPREIWVGADYHITTCHRLPSEEETTANIALIANAPETLKQRDGLRAACEAFAKFADKDLPKGLRLPEAWLDELRDKTHLIKAALAAAE